MKNILQTYSAVELRKFISKTNIKGITKMNKQQLIEVMTKKEHINRFKHIKPKGQKTEKKTLKPTPIKKEPIKKSKPDLEEKKRKLQQKIKDAGGKDDYLKKLGKTTKGRAGAKIRNLVDFKPKKKEEPKPTPIKKKPKKKEEKDDELIKKNRKKQKELIKLLNKNKSKLEKKIIQERGYMENIE